MILKFKKGFGESLLNTVRQIAMTQIPAVRPIAFSVGTHSNVITIDDQIIEDMVTFISNVCSANYITQSSSKFFEINTTVSGTLDLLGLCKSSEISLISGNKEVLHSLADLPVRVVFRNGCGSAGVEENTLFLEENHVDVTNLTVINSRHSNIASFSVKKCRDENDLEVFDVSIETFDGVSETKVFEQSTQILEDLVISLKKSGV